MVLSTAVACVHRAKAPSVSASRCEPLPPRSAVPYTSRHDSALVGRFRLIALDTTEQPVTSRTRVVSLRLVDSAERAASKVNRRFAHAANRDLQLVDARDPEPDTGLAALQVQVDDGLLILGCRDCLDGIIVVYRVAAVSPSGFWGTWHDPQTGIGRVVDKNGRFLPDPGGYFCAVRTEAPR
jgi:hypothetical protein